MKLKKKLALLLSGLLLVTTLSACAKEEVTDSTDDNDNQTETQATDTDTVPLGGHLSVSLGPNPETIDPQLNSSVDGADYIIHMFEGIMRYTRDGESVEYGQAANHEVSDDGLVWTFTLRDDIVWTDGQPVTAEDFVYSWRRLVDPDTGAPYAFDMGKYIKNGHAITEGSMSPEELGVVALDEKTLEVTTEELCPYFLELMAFPVFYPVRKDMIEANGDAWIRTSDTYLTNGAFKMQSFTLDDRMVVVKNELYWDAENILPEGISFLFLSDDVARLAALRSGEIALASDFPQEEKNALEAAGMYIMAPMLGTYYYNFNNAVEPFDDPLVRKALTLACDNAFIAYTLREGAVIPAEAFVGAGFHTSGHDVAFRDEGATYIDPYTYEENKEEAKAALAEAGYPDGEGFPKIEIMINESAGHTMIAEAIQAMWKDVLNVNAEIRSVEWSVLLTDRREGNFQVARDGWIGDYNDPVTMLNLFTTASDNNSAFYSNPEYDALLQAQMRERDPAARSALLHQAEDIMLGQDWACLPIYYYTRECAKATNFTGFANSLLGYTFLFNAYLAG